MAKIEIKDLIDRFQADEGIIESWTGSIGSGKTYGATRRILKELLRGQYIYVNYPVDFSSFSGDWRSSFGRIFVSLVFFSPVLYDIDIQRNLRIFSVDDPSTWWLEDPETGKKTIYPTVVDFILAIKNAKVYLDEGQDLFDSYEGTKMSLDKRKSLTRTRHASRTLVIISQRPQAIAVTARANVRFFHRHILVMSWPIKLFKVYTTEDIDSSNMPIFTVADPKGRQKMQAKLTDWYIGSSKIFRAYDTKFFGSTLAESQQLHIDAYRYNWFQRFWLLLKAAVRRKQ